MLLLVLNSVIYGISLSLNFYLFLKEYTRTREKWMCILAIYILCMLITHILTVMASYFYDSNLVVSHVFTFAHFICLAFFYREIIESKLIRKGIAYSLIFSSLIILFQYLIVPYALIQFSGFEVFLVNYNIIIFGLIYSYRNLAMNPKYNIVNIGIITYCFLVTSTFLYGNYLILVEVEKASKFWILNDYINLFLQVMIFAQYIHNKRRALA